jgi:hypothetical protein
MRRSALIAEAMQELVKLFTQIVLLRRGPQDLPASMLLLALTIVAYLAMNLLLDGLLPPLAAANGAARVTEADQPNLSAQALVDTVYTLAWYVTLLRIAGRPERTLQTATAVFGMQIVLVPLLVLSRWLAARYPQDTPWFVPVTLCGIVLAVWFVAANSHIVKAALEWSLGASVAITILQIVTDELLQRALFPIAQG